MTAPQRAIPRTPLLWFGLLGGPAAWTSQHVFGMGMTLAACNVAGTRWGIPVVAWTIAAMVSAAVVTVLAGLASLEVWRDTRDAGEQPPGSRIHFLSVVGMTINPLFLFIILMSGLGASVLGDCRQG